MIPNNNVNIWFHTKNSLYNLYKKRAEGYGPEMDCHAQAAQLYRPFFNREDKILDAAGGSGYFYWSLKKRELLGYYHLLDYTKDFIQMGRDSLKSENPTPIFLHNSIQEISEKYDTVFCINSLFCLPDYRQALDKLLISCRKIFILRTCLDDKNIIRYENDEYLDESANELRSYFNIWAIDEINDFIKSFGFKVFNPIDRRTEDKGEISAGKFFPWRWVLAVRD